VLGAESSRRVHHRALTTVRRLAPILLSSLVTSACWVPMERGRQMEARIQRLEVETREQAQELEGQVKEKIALVDKKLREVQAKLDELNTTARAKGADLGVAVGRLQEDLTKVRGDLEAEQHQLDELGKLVQASSKETETRLAALKGTGALDEAMARQKLSELPRPDDKPAVLALAQKEDANGSSGVARELYLHYVKRWPRDEHADEAGFRAGELLVAQGRWREAVVVFGKVAEDHPKSDKTPSALLEVAEGMVQLERKEDARAFFEQVIAEHPKSEAAVKAKSRLAELFPPARKPAPKKK
jgi:TolA-binding protein